MFRVLPQVNAILAEMGPNILKGGSTTFLGVACFLLARSHIFRVFFKMFVGIVGFGLLHGFVFVPVMLSFVPLGWEKTWASRTAETKNEHKQGGARVAATDGPDAVGNGGEGGGMIEMAGNGGTTS